MSRFLILIALSSFLVTAAQAETVLWDVPEVLSGNALLPCQLDVDPGSEILLDTFYGFSGYEIGGSTQLFGVVDPSYGGLAAFPADYDNDGNIEIVYYTVGNAWHGQSVHSYDTQSGQIDWSLVSNDPDINYVLTIDNFAQELRADDGTLLLGIRCLETNGLLVDVLWDRIITLDDTSVGVRSSSSRRNPSMSIHEDALQFDLSHAGMTSVEVYDVTGRLISQPMHLEERAAGSHELSMEGLPSSGVYFVHLTSPDGTNTKKLVRVR